MAIHVVFADPNNYITIITDGYDDNLNLVSSRTEDENPISPAPEK